MMIYRYVTEEEIGNRFTNAIKGDVSNYSIHLDDVSPVEHKAEVKIKNTNLSKPFDYSSIDITNSLSLTFSDNLLTLNGSSKNTISMNKLNGTILPPGTYTFSNQYISGTCVNTVGNDNAFYFVVRNNAGKTFTEIACYGAAAMMSTRSKSFTITETTEIRYYFVGAGEFENYKSRIMLNDGTTVEPYTPYIENLEDVTLYASGKNLFNPSNVSASRDNVVLSSNYGKIDSKIYDGEIKFTALKYTYNPDNSSSYPQHYVNGVFYIFVDEAFMPISESGNTYTLVADIVLDERFNNTVDGEAAPDSIAFNGVGGSLTSATVVWTGTTKEGKQKGKVFGKFVNKYYKNGSVIDYTRKNLIEVRTVGKSITFTNIMLLPGNQTQNLPEYEEYNGTTYTVNTDGTVDNVVSIAPVMNLSTDTNGVLIECNYNRGTNKVFEKLTNAIISLGGNV